VFRLAIVDGARLRMCRVYLTTLRRCTVRPRLTHFLPAPRRGSAAPPLSSQFRLPNPHQPLRSGRSTRASAAQWLLHGCRMRSRTFAGVMLSCLLAGVAGAPIALADQASPAPSGCPAYRTHLLAARASLEHADRPGAIAALRQAREALDSCLGGSQGAPVAMASGTRDDAR
jgi:hypothetical protein